MKAGTIQLDGKPVGFVARESTFGTCEGCMFGKRPFETCARAETAARKAGQPDCDDRAPNGGNYIYVLADERQLVLGEGA